MKNFGNCMDCSKRLHKRRAKRCQDCYHLWQKGRHPSPQTQFKKGIRNNIVGEFKKGHIPWNNGILRFDIVGENHPMWKGDNVGYQGVHIWIRKQLGSAFWCYVCMSVDDPKTKYGYANISREYKRELTDWIPLCAKCHREYDKGNKQEKFNIINRKYVRK